MVEDGVVDAFAVQRLDRVLHRIQLRHVDVRDDADALRAQVLEVHADLLGAPGAEADAGRGHLEGIFLLPRGVDGGS